MPRALPNARWLVFGGRNASESCRSPLQNRDAAHMCPRSCVRFTSIQIRETVQPSRATKRTCKQPGSHKHRMYEVLPTGEVTRVLNLTVARRCCINSARGDDVYAQQPERCLC